MSPGSAIFAADPARFSPHALHDGARHWPETNCYADLWIEVVASLGHPPEAMLGHTVLQDFEGDHFTFFKVPLEDLAALYGVRVGELALFDRLERHAAEQLSRGRLVLVEVDGFHLPDTRGVSYRKLHTKTTIAIARLDVAARRLVYFHNAGLFSLAGEDYDGIFGRAGEARDPAQLFPYAEFAKFGQAAADLPETARRILLGHLRDRPGLNPIRAYGAALPAHLDDLASRPADYFHVYAFNTLRQLGANFELLGSHLAWLGGALRIDLDAPRAAADAIAEGAKVMQFRLARATARRRSDGLADGLVPLATHWDALMASLDASGLASDVPHAPDIRRAA